MITVTKDFTFDAAHFLRDYVGPCADMHGHTYKGSVTVASGAMTDTGDMVIDFKILNEIIKMDVVAKFDHSVINEVVDYNPTAENMVMDIATTVQCVLQQGFYVVKVDLWETPTSCATWSR